MKYIDCYRTSMPYSRSAHYYLGCHGGCIFVDFNENKEHSVSMIRISFDGYGCCNLEEKAVPLDLQDSKTFLAVMKQKKMDQQVVSEIVLKAIKLNQANIWEDALKAYELI